MLYSLNGKFPSTIPFRITLSDGRTRTDSSTFTEEEIADAGYVLVDNPPQITENQICSWNSELLSWSVRDKTEEELRQEHVNSIPKIVSMRQARLALLQNNLLESVNTALALMEGVEGEAARIEWEYATEVNLYSPLVSSLSQSLALTEDQLYDLFLLASSL
jgi:hypothetical protein